MAARFDPPVYDVGGMPGADSVGCHRWRYRHAGAGNGGERKPARQTATKRSPEATEIAEFTMTIVCR
jgi:hypothetical protein